MNEAAIVEFATKVGIVFGAVAAVIALIRMLWKWGPVAIRGDLDREIENRMSVDVEIKISLKHVIDVIELYAIIAAEPPGSPAHEDAMLELQAKRRVITSGPY